MCVCVCVYVCVRVLCRQTMPVCVYVCVLCGQCNACVFGKRVPMRLKYGWPLIKTEIV